MKEISVSGQKRATTGKKASKEMRKEGLVPCNLYGEKKGENGAPIRHSSSSAPSRSLFTRRLRCKHHHRRRGSQGSNEGASVPPNNRCTDAR